MPKMKTNRSAAKRFKRTGSGKLRRNHAFTSHLLEGKSPKRKRKLRKAALVSKGDQKRLAQALAYLK
jgi:large subunit ribosomal protein L35